MTLVESAQNILALNSEAAKIFREAQEIMSQVKYTYMIVESLLHQSLSNQV